jgi:hypothetical protein
MPEPVLENTMDRLIYTIKYVPLCTGKILDIPETLHYKPIDGFTVTKLNELNVDTIDEGLNGILDALCFESKYQGFTHWKLTVEEKIRAYLNLRLNSTGSIVEHLVGICESCGKEKLFLKVEIGKFDEKDLSPKYIEPFPLKVKVNGTEKKFKGRILRSGDIYRAKQTYEKDKGLIRKLFPEATDKDNNVVIQILEYANSILEIENVKPSFEDAVNFCKNNLDVMNAITSFNDYFQYGMTLKVNDICTQAECPTVSVDEKTGSPIHRGSLFRFPLQPGLFYITHTQKETVEQYFDLQ